MTIRVGILSASLAVLTLSADPVCAHALWAEPIEGGYKIYFGEPGKKLREKKEKLADFAALKAWDAQGKEVKAKAKVEEDHLFIPAGPGDLTAAGLDAPLYGEGEKAGKPIFYLRHLVDPGKPVKPSKSLFLEILPDAKDSLAFVVLKGGKPFPEAWVEVVSPSGWNRSFQADQTGKVRIEAPWPGLYILESGTLEKTGGKQNGKPYGSTWHAFTLSFMKK